MSRALVTSERSRQWARSEAAKKKGQGGPRTQVGPKDGAQTGRIMEALDHGNRLYGGNSQ